MCRRSSDTKNFSVWGLLHYEKVCTICGPRTRHAQDSVWLRPILRHSNRTKIYRCRLNVLETSTVFWDNTDIQYKVCTICGPRPWCAQNSVCDWDQFSDIHLHHLISRKHAQFFTLLSPGFLKSVKPGGGGRNPPTHHNSTIWRLIAIKFGSVTLHYKCCPTT